MQKVPMDRKLVLLEEIEEDRWYASASLPWSRTTLWRMRKEGLRGVRVGRGLVFRGGAILEWLKSREGK